MHFEIRSAVQAQHKLNKVQRTSSGFTETPVVAGKILRRGSVLKLSSKQFDLARPKIEKLLKSHSITVEEVVGGDDEVTNAVEEKADSMAPEGAQAADTGGGDSAAGSDVGGGEQAALPPDLAPAPVAVAAPVVDVPPPAPVMPPVVNQPSVHLPTFDKNTKHNKKGK